jgi:hypothetical protein
MARQQLGIDPIGMFNPINNFLSPDIVGQFYSVRFDNFDLIKKIPNMWLVLL